MKFQVTQDKRSKVRWFTLGLFLLAFLTPLPVMAALSQRQKITSVPRGVGAQFGYAVAINGNTMVVGARFDSTTAASAGSAFVYVLNGTIWTQQAQLLASDGAAFDKFGQSVAISEDTIVVGASQANAPLSNGGAAYVFVRNGTTWTQQQKLTASDGTADDEFGHSVAITGEIIVVGAHFADLPSNSSAGSAYLYSRSGTVWTQFQKLIPTGGVVLGDLFGESAAISGNKIVLGSSGADVPETAAGSVYVFVESGGLYFLQQKLSIPDGTNGDSFGFSVSIEGNTLVGGAREDTPIIGQPAFGAAYVFEFNGATWTQQQKLTASDGAAFDRFGWSVAVSNNIVAVGAREDDTIVGPDAGSAYVFTRSGTTWTQQQKLEPDDSFNGDRFGASVALSFGKLAVGAAEKNLTNPNGQGAVYTFSSPIGFLFPDFDGDRIADLSFYNSGIWGTTKSSDSSVSLRQFGVLGDLIAPGDYDGDGKTDIGIFRAGTWYRLYSSDDHFDAVTFGTTGDLPIPGDFDGDGRADLSVFRPSTGTWLRLNSSNNQAVTVVFGITGDIPLIADFDGDGKADISVFRAGVWYILRSSDNSIVSIPFGTASDIPVPADYDGDGKTDVGVFRPDGANWFIQISTTGVFITPFGLLGDVPVPADYDGDGQADMAVFRPSTGTWYMQRSTQGFRSVQFGMSGAEPIPLFFVRQALPTPTSIIQLSAVNYSAGEGAGHLDVTVTRTGNTTNAAAVNFRTTDDLAEVRCDVLNGTAYARCDYATTVDTLMFAPGENTKSFSISIIDDAYVEGSETFGVALSGPTGATLGATTTATATINDNDVVNGPNPILTTPFFVSQQYLDFLSREPEAAGFSAWVGVLNNCSDPNNNPSCDRILVSSSFFASQEFQLKGYFVYRFYKLAFNRLPLYPELVTDMRTVTGQTAAEVFQKKAAFTNEFLLRTEFANTFGPLTNSQYVNALMARYGLTQITTPDPAAPDGANKLTLTIANLTSQLNGHALSRAQVLRAIADSDEVFTVEFFRAFVAMQYYGYLRRAPDTPGYNAWLAYLNGNPTDFRTMVNGFMNSIEYRLRFGAP
jgi:hypothetical protein